jgi:hypothetical protein
MWAGERDLNPSLLDAVTQVHKIYRITAMLWSQGEADYLYKTPAATYTASFHSMVKSLRNAGMVAPIFITIETRCPAPGQWRAKNEISDAQRSFIDPANGIFMGVNTDAMMGPLDRYDECHFSGTGQEKFSEGWANTLQAYVESRASLSSPAVIP